MHCSDLPLSSPLRLWTFVPFSALPDSVALQVLTRMHVLQAFAVAAVLAILGVACAQPFAPGTGFAPAGTVKCLQVQAIVPVVALLQLRLPLCKTRMCVMAMNFSDCLAMLCR